MLFLFGHYCSFGSGFRMGFSLEPTACNSLFVRNLLNFCSASWYAFVSAALRCRSNCKASYSAVSTRMSGLVAALLRRRSFSAVSSAIVADAIARALGPAVVGGHRGAVAGARRLVLFMVLLWCCG